jgi:hypothetical protein
MGGNVGSHQNGEQAGPTPTDRKRAYRCWRPDCDIHWVAGIAVAIGVAQDQTVFYSFCAVDSAAVIPNLVSGIGAVSNQEAANSGLFPDPVAVTMRGPNRLLRHRIESFGR